MAREWTDDEISAEIRKNVQIVAEDRERAEYNRLHERYKETPGNTLAPDGKVPPPAKDDAGTGDKANDAVKKRKSLWWGEAINDPPAEGGGS